MTGGSYGAGSHPNSGAFGTADAIYDVDHAFQLLHFILMLKWAEPYASIYFVLAN